MDKNHTLNNDKFIAALKARGWTIDSYGTLTRPIGRSLAQGDDDYRQAILECIECKLANKVITK